MNPDRPQKPQPSYGDRFERNDDIDDISVSYEEISPEEQSRIKQAAESSDQATEVSGTPTDIWSSSKSAALPVEEVEWQESDSSQSRDPVDTAAPKTPQDSQQSDPLLHEEQSPKDKPEPKPDLGNEPVKVEPSLESRSPEDELLENDFSSDQSVDPKPTQENPDNLNLNPEDISELSEQDLLPQTTANEEEANWDSEDRESEPRDSLDGLLDTEVASPLLQEPGEFSTPKAVESEPNPEPTKPEPASESEAPELIAAKWLDDLEQTKPPQANSEKVTLNSEITQLKAEKAALLAEIAQLKQQKELAIAEQAETVNLNLAQMIQEGTRELKGQKNRLLVDIEKLERRKQRIDQEMRSTFAGSSQDLAMRIQGFKKYLVGSLQDLSTAAEKLELAQAPPKQPSREPRLDRDNRPTQDQRPPRQERPYDGRRSSNSRGDSRSDTRPSDRSRPDRSRPDRRGGMQATPNFGEQAFDDKNRRIRQLLDQYRTRPDYYGAPWQLRRTFEQVHSERVQEWFFGQGGRGTVKGMGSRLQNILVASAVVSVLHQLYRDRCRILVLVDSPEKLGEWRRGLCDCLGISRNDFGANRGIDLFDSADVLVQRAERLLDDKLMPLVVIDEAEGLVNLGLLKFPLWLAFSEKPQQRASGYPY